MTNHDQTGATPDGIAVIGMAGRFPGASTLDEFWRNLVAGVESIARFDADRLPPGVAATLAADADARYVPARGIIEGVDLFDAAFFGITPAEAEVLDPQQRLFLEAAWEAFERAGYDPAAYAGAVGVFAGMSNNSYFAAQLRGRDDVINRVGALQAMMANEKDYLATRVSYKLDLKGPSVSVQTACSTSLVAVCQAVESLLAYRCDVALAGGVSVVVPQDQGYVCQDGGITSSDGTCRAFDIRAEGTVFSNGLGVVVLKRLSDALADGDRVSAVIKGAAINNDGSAKVSFLAPSVDGHADAVAVAQAAAGIDPRTVSYIEAHGTGTALGDVVEVAALNQAFRLHTADTGFCALGSVKTNIGHLDAASGVAGLIKAVLALQHRTIPPTLHFTAPNPKLSLDQTPFFVNTSPIDWTAGPVPRRAGVSSLGVGGTNAHVVLEEAPESVPSTDGRGVEVLVLSARTADALERATRNLREHLANGSDAKLADVAFTLQTGRRSFPHRRALACRTRAEALSGLDGSGSLRAATAEASSNEIAVAFVFPDTTVGVDAGRDEWLAREVAFRQAFEQCQTLAGAAGTSQDVQCFATEYALSRLWTTWGVTPQIAVGHGVGALVAAVVAGILSVEDAIAAVVNRDELGTIQGLRFGAPTIPVISAITGDWLTPEQAADPAYWIAALERGRKPATACDALDSPESTVIGLLVGPAAANAAAAKMLGTDASRRIATSLRDGVAAMESILGALGELWVHGVQVDWVTLHAGERRARVPLPTYPFERKRYWVDAAPTDAAAPQPAIQVQTAEIVQAAARDVRVELVALMSELSGLPESEFETGATFFELGLDSLFLTQAATVIYKRFGVRIRFAELLEDANSIPAIAARLEQATPSGPAIAPASESARRPLVASPTPSASSSASASEARTAGGRAHGPFRPVDASAVALTATQTRALESFVNRYTARTVESKRLTAASRARLADPRTVAGFRSTWKEIVYPIVAARSAGSKLWDVDGNEYIDLVNGFGTNLFGHSPAFVTTAIEAQLKSGIEIGPQSPLAGRVAALACEMLGHERLAFCNTGSEAVTAAIRMARTVTGRDTIAFFSGAYHGTFDEALARATHAHGALRSTPIAPGIPASACENVLVLEYGSAEALDVLRARGSELAAVLVEPVQSRRPELQPAKFLRDLRQITARSETALVFDEVVTGFRAHPGGAQAIFGIHPDLATYGKVVGGGLPIGLVAGSARYLDTLDGGEWQYGDDSFPSVGMTFFAGTFVRHPLALSAAYAVLDHLKREGPELQRRLNLRATELVERLNAAAFDLGAPVSVAHFSSWFCFRLPADLPYGSLFYAYLRSKGVHVWEGRPGFITTAHTDADLSRIVDAFTDTIAEMQEGGLLPKVDEAPPIPGARRGRRPDGRAGWFVPDPQRPSQYLEVGLAR